MPKGVTAVKPIPTASVFHETLKVRFEDASAKPPYRGQSDTAHRELGADAGPFIEWATAAELQKRKVRHGGVLPALIAAWRARGPDGADEEKARALRSMREHAEQRRAWNAEARKACR